MIRHPPSSTLFPSTPLFRFWAGQLLRPPAQPPAPPLVLLPARMPIRSLESRSVVPRQLPRGIVYAANTLSDRKSTRLNSSHLVISYAVFCLKKKKTENTQHP